MKNKYILLIILLIITIPSVWYLFLPGFIKTDDGDWMIIRFSAFYQALRDGQFPVRFLARLNFGYGYPVANFLYPGFMYLAVPFKAVGFSFVDSIKIILGLSTIGSGILMFYFLKKYFDGISAFFGSIFYVYAPYHLYDLVKRGSVGELLSLLLVPFILWQIGEGSVVLSSLLIALLIISHNTLAVLFLPLIFIFMICLYFQSKKKKDLIGKYLMILISGLGLSAFFWLPASIEVFSTVFLKTKISSFAEYFADIELVGLSIVLVFISTFFILILKRKIYKENYLVLIFFVVGALSLFFSVYPSIIFWNILPVNFIQFPFRFLSLTIVCTAFLVSFSLTQFKFRSRIFIGVIFTLFTMFLSREYLVNIKVDLRSDGYYSTNEATTTVLDEYMPNWVLSKPQKHFESKVNVIAGNGTINNVHYTSKKITFDYFSETPSIVRISTIYYPGWEIYSNDKLKAIYYDNEFGDMDIKLSSGNQKVKAEFKETPIRLISDFVSLFTFISLIIYGFRTRLIKFINK